MPLGTGKPVRVLTYEHISSCTHSRSADTGTHDMAEDLTIESAIFGRLNLADTIAVVQYTS